MQIVGRMQIVRSLVGKFTKIIFGLLWVNCLKNKQKKQLLLKSFLFVIKVSIVIFKSVIVLVFIKKQDG